MLEHNPFNYIQTCIFYLSVISNWGILFYSAQGVISLTELVPATLVLHAYIILREVLVKKELTSS